MTPEAFLQLSILNKAYRKKAWLFSIFSVTRENEAQKKNIYPGKLEREPFGLFTYTAELEKVQLEVPKEKLNEPLFRPSDAVTISADWVSSLQEPKIQTTVGRLLINVICLVEAFGSRFPYQNGPITIKGLEKVIASKLKSTPKHESDRKDEFFYVDELIKFGEGVIFLESLSQVIAHSVTEVGLLPAPGRKAFKAELLKQYEGQLSDPIKMAAFEKALKDFDQAYLKNDPAYGRFMAGKVSNARIKSFMTLGGEEDGFTEKQGVTPVIPALEDGSPLEPTQFTALVNASRYGSFSRGAETVNGGVVAKSLGRAADSWKIVEGDCKTPFGVKKLYRKEKTYLLVGRYIIEGKNIKLIETEEQASQYAGQKVIVRSPQYCRQPGTATCSICAGVGLSKYPNGLSIPLMEVSGGILLDSLKKMHNNALATATMDLSTVLS